MNRKEIAVGFCFLLFLGLFFLPLWAPGFTGEKRRDGTYEVTAELPNDKSLEDKKVKGSDEAAWTWIYGIHAQAGRRPIDCAIFADEFLKERNKRYPR